LKKLEIILRPEKLEDLKDLMIEKNIYGMTVSMVNGCGQQLGKKEMYRGTEVSINLLPKAKVEIVLPNKKADEFIPEIIEALKTETIGDGKIFVYECSAAYRIRTGECGEKVL
jgi:nitrogen regulatory protein P-II 1